MAQTVNGLERTDNISDESTTTSVSPADDRSMRSNGVGVSNDLCASSPPEDACGARGRGAASSALIQSSRRGRLHSAVVDVARQSLRVLRRVIRALVRPRGSRKWDFVVRGTGVVAALGIPIVVLFPERAPLVWFALLAIPANGPLSPVIPVAFEPLILEAAKYEAPALVAFVGLCVYMYMEFLNWHIYGWVVHRDSFAGMRHHRLTRYGVRLFGTHPFVAVIFFAVSPLPFWVVRILALLKQYPPERFFLATAIGRAPRLLLLAHLGALLRPSTLLLVGVLVTTTLVAVVWAKKKTQVATTTGQTTGSE